MTVDASTERHLQFDLPEGGLLAVLDAIVSDPTKEAEWLEFLAQLEYIGCRKILRALPYEDVTVQVLRHVTDEATHALVLKQAAALLGGEERSWAEYPLSEIGYGYFRELDRSVSALEETQGRQYPAVSWVVEQRALSLYPLYLARTQRPEVRRALQMILAQEKNHSAQFDDATGFQPPVRSKIVAIETGLWARAMEAVRARFLGEDARACHAFPQSDISEIRATD